MNVDFGSGLIRRQDGAIKMRKLLTAVMGGQGSGEEVELTRDMGGSL